MGMMDGGLGQKRGYPGNSGPYPPNQYGGRQYGGNMPYPMGGGPRGQTPNSIGGGNQYGQQVTKKCNISQEFLSKSKNMNVLCLQTFQTVLVRKKHITLFHIPCNLYIFASSFMIQITLYQPPAIDNVM